MNRLLSCIKFFLFIIIAIGFSAPSFAQQTIDSTKQKFSAIDSTKFVNTHTHSARKATICSAILPGLGQAYNKSYWKIPVVYVGFGAMVYFFETNNKQYKSFKTALIQRTNGDTDIYLKQVPTTQGLSDYKDYYRRNRDLSVIGFALIYILNVVDADVDANLFYFDVSDDLSLQWSPVINPSYSYASGVSLRLKF